MGKIKDFKSPSSSFTIKTEVVCPNDANPMDILQGGRLVEWMDIGAAVCAQTHCGKICVTASINHVDFYSAAKIGDIITILARITRAFNTSMEIYVHAFARKVTSEKKYLVSKAYFTFVALDDLGKATPIISVNPVTKEDKIQFDAALLRKERIAKGKKKRQLMYHK